MPELSQSRGPSRFLQETSTVTAAGAAGRVGGTVWPLQRRLSGVPAQMLRWAVSRLSLAAV